MKKILALALTSLLLAGSFGAVASATAETPAPAPTAEENVSAKNTLYLVPGTYVSGGAKVENTIAEGATKLTDEQCAEIFTDNAYACTLTAGAKLPAPASDKIDKDGNKFTFNGWWTIVDATVTYFDTVPELSETTFLYADWRADLSQRKDPIIPDAGVVVEPDHYLMITRKATGETERITLRKAFTNNLSAETLGYLYPVELFAEGFELCPGDVVKVYTTGLSDSDKAVISPVITGSTNNREIQLESSGDKLNSTSDYLTSDVGSQRKQPTLTCITEQTGTYNIYIKYFNKGATMAVYMEPKA